MYSFFWYIFIYIHGPEDDLIEKVRTCHLNCLWSKV